MLTYFLLILLIIDKIFILAHCSRDVEITERRDTILEGIEKLEKKIDKVEEKQEEILKYIKCIKNIFNFIFNSIEHVIHLKTI